MCRAFKSLIVAKTTILNALCEGLVLTAVAKRGEALRYAAEALRGRHADTATTPRPTYHHHHRCCHHHHHHTVAGTLMLKKRSTTASSEKFYFLPRIYFFTRSLS